MVVRYIPEMKGRKGWMGFPNAYSFGDKRLAEQQLAYALKMRKLAGLPTLKTRIVKENIKI